MEFRIKNDPKIELNGTKVKPKHGQIGQGKEFMTKQPVEVENFNKIWGQYIN